MDTRKADWEQIRQDSKSSDPVVRDQAHKAAIRIQNESGKVRSMREALVKAHRESNKTEIADIHNWVEKHPEYKNDR